MYYIKGLIIDLRYQTSFQPRGDQLWTTRIRSADLTYAEAREAADKDCVSYDSIEKENEFQCNDARLVSDRTAHAAERVLERSEHERTPAAAKRRVSV